MTHDPDAPVTLVSVPTDVEATAIVAALAARGVEATITGAYTAGFRAEAPGEVAVVVRQRDLDQARQAMVEIQHDQAKIDWSQVDVGTDQEP